MTPEERAAANVARMLWAGVLKELEKTPKEYALYFAKVALCDLADLAAGTEDEDRITKAVEYLFLGRL